MTYSINNPYRTSGDIYYPFRVIMFIGFLSMGYLLSRPNAADIGEKDFLFDTGVIDSPCPMSWQIQASRKAVERYAAAQDKKWQRWNEAMFERKS